MARPRIPLRQRGAMESPLSPVERIAAFVASPRTILTVLGAGLAWAVVNTVLARHGLAPDPFPFRWMQRVSLFVNLSLILVVLRTQSARRARLEREDADRARRDLAHRVLLETIVVETTRQRTRPRSAPRAAKN